MKTTSLAILGSLIIATFMLVSCSPTAHIEKDSNTDFGKYRTFAWIDHEKEDGKASGLEGQNVHNAVANELEKIGLREVKSNPDVLVNYDVLVERANRKQSEPVYSQSYSRVFYNPYTRRYGTIYYPSQFLGYENYNVPVREGTLTITMTDAQTDRTVWQGWTTEEVNSRRMTNDEIQSYVKAIMRKFDVARK
ncbi:MAG: DUF4136 domain-containing protein [Gemmatimonadaceae bacterium]|nr:DUF4136 domain-containing protein [Chitinophagaceae bacterium]